MKTCDGMDEEKKRECKLNTYKPACVVWLVIALHGEYFFISVLV